MVFRKLNNDDKTWVNDFVKRQWGSEQIIVHNKIYLPSKLEGFVAEDNNVNVGLITFEIQNQCCEIVSLNSIVEHKGIGRELVKLVTQTAKAQDCRTVWLITTNDNIRAIDFYQKMGFQLIKVYPNAVDNSRKIKPEIRLIAENGIPIRDELELVLKLLDD